MSPDDVQKTIIGSADDANRVLREEAEGRRLLNASEEFPERQECMFEEIYGDMAGL